jgi:hypothetical protein
MYHQVLTSINSTFCPKSVFLCFERISEQTAIIPTHIKSQTGFYNTDGKRLLRGTECILYIIQVVIFKEMKVKSSKPQWSLYIPPGLKLKILRSAHTTYLCVLYGSRNKQRLFPYTTLTDCFYNRDGVCLQRGTDWVFIYNSTFCPHSVFMCFVWISEQTAIISLYNID